MAALSNVSMFFAPHIPPRREFPVLRLICWGVGAQGLALNRVSEKRDLVFPSWGLFVKEPVENEAMDARLLLEEILRSLLRREYIESLASSAPSVKVRTDGLRGSSRCSSVGTSKLLRLPLLKKETLIRDCLRSRDGRSWPRDGGGLSGEPAYMKSISSVSMQSSELGSRDELRLVLFRRNMVGC